MDVISENKAFFLDRDGVINVDHGYVSCIDDFQFVDGLFPVLRSIVKKGYLLVVVTNQSGIGRGYYTQEDFSRITEWMLRQFEDEGVPVAGVYSCPHRPEADCNCRKPAPGLLLQALRDHGINPAISWMIGDKPSDMQAAEAAGIHNRVLFGSSVSAHNTHTISAIQQVLTLPI